MSSLSGKMVRQVEIKSDGDVFHQIVRDRPHHISNMYAANLQGVELHNDDWGTVDSVIFVNYTHGKMSSLSGKMVRQVENKSDGDVFPQIFRYRLHHISDMFAANIQGVELHDGDWGTYEKEKIAKEIIEAIDEENKAVVFKVIGEDLMELYKFFKLTVHVDTEGENNLVTWTFDYEKQSEGVEDPNTLMDFYIDVTKDIETHYLQLQT